MDLDYYAVVTKIEKVDKVWIIFARCETCGQDVQHGGTSHPEPELGPRVPHCRCPIPSYTIINESLDHPIPEKSSKAELALNEPLTVTEAAAILTASCPACDVGPNVLCSGQRWRVCPARVSRYLRSLEAL